MTKLRYVAGVLVGLMSTGIAGCGGGGTVNAGSGGMGGAPMGRPLPARQGMSTQKKVLLLAGAAALYYMYNKQKNAKGHGAEGQYYRSKNGRIYYRDRQGNPVWVTAPQQPIRVPAEEYERYTGQRAGNYGENEVVRQAPAGW